MFYLFRQNNSGGIFTYDEKDGLSVNVLIEADSAKEANEKAHDIGIYFDGCEYGDDCSCCGDRWHRVDDLDGNEKPSIYGDTDLDDNNKRQFKKIKDGYDTFVHYKNGLVKGFNYG